MSDLHVSTEQIWELWDFAAKLSSPGYLPSSLEKKCLITLSRFLQHKGQMKGISEFRKMFGYSYSESYDLKTEIKDFLAKGVLMSIGGSIHYEINSKGENEPVGVFVYQDQRPNFYEITERIYFEELFTYQFIKLQSALRNRFLSFQLNETFKGNRAEFLKFLNGITCDYSDIIKNYNKVLDDWIKEVTESKLEIPKKYSVKQIALSIVYKQKALTIDEIIEGEKLKRIKEIAKNYECSYNTLLDAYNSFSGNGTRSKRVKFLEKSENQLAMKEILQGDTNALDELKKEINK